MESKNAEILGCMPLHWYPLRPCYAPGPGLGSVGNLELNQILLLKSLQKELEKWIHLLYVGQQQILELPPCSVVLNSSCTLESPEESLHFTPE